MGVEEPGCSFQDMHFSTGLHKYSSCSTITHMRTHTHKEGGLSIHRGSITHKQWGLITCGTSVPGIPVDNEFRVFKPVESVAHSHCPNPSRASPGASSGLRMPCNAIKTSLLGLGKSYFFSFLFGQNGHSETHRRYGAMCGLCGPQKPPNLTHSRKER